jgi:hypothetical protein
MDRQAFLGSGKKSWIPLSSFALSPDYFCGFLFFLLLTNLKIFAFFRFCAIIQRGFFFWRGERALFFLLTLNTYYYSSSSARSFPLTLLLGLPFVCFSLSVSVTTTIQPSRQKNGWEDSLD